MNGYIELITGTLGGGKTMYAVERIYDHLRQGGWVFTNITMKPDAIAVEMARRHRRKFDPSRLVVWTGSEAREPQKHVMRGTKERCVMLVIDEAGLEHNARDHAKTERDLLAMVTLARKLELVILFITQQSTDFDKQMRGKCRCEWQCRNLHNLRMFGLIPVKIPLFSRICFDTTKNKREYLCHDVLPRPKWVCELYDSDALVGRGQDAASGLLVADGAPLEVIESVNATAGQWPNVLWGAAACAFAFSFF